MKFALIASGGIGKNKMYFIDIHKDHKLKVLTKSRLEDLLRVNEELLNQFKREEVFIEVYIKYLNQLNKTHHDTK